MTAPDFSFLYFWAVVVWLINSTLPVLALVAGVPLGFAVLMWLSSFLREVWVRVSELL